MTCLHSCADQSQRVTRPDCSAGPGARKQQRWGSRGQPKSSKAFPCFSAGIKSEVQTVAFLVWRGGGGGITQWQSLAGVSGDAWGAPRISPCPLRGDAGLCHHRLQAANLTCLSWALPEVCERDYANLIQFFGGVETVGRLTLPW